MRLLGLDQLPSTNRMQSLVWAGKTTLTYVQTIIVTIHLLDPQPRSSKVARGGRVVHTGLFAQKMFLDHTLVGIAVTISFLG